MNLKHFFEEHPRVAVAFSGGVDSSYLLYAATLYAEEVKGYYVKSQFQPEFEREDAERLAESIHVDVEWLVADVLADEAIVSNPEDRCYYCKKDLFAQIQMYAALDGFEVILDGTNASDDADDRPGMKALEELGVLSPLRMCGLTKDYIRILSRNAGLFTWNKPSYACLATRIPTGMRIEEEMLASVEQGEDALREMGYSDFRIRVTKDGCARIQVKETDMDRAFREREKIKEALAPFFSDILLDLNARPVPNPVIEEIIISDGKKKEEPEQYFDEFGNAFEEEDSEEPIFDENALPDDFEEEESTEDEETEEEKETAEETMEEVEAAAEEAEAEEESAGEFLSDEEAEDLQTGDEFESVEDEDMPVREDDYTEENQEI